MVSMYCFWQFLVTFERTATSLAPLQTGEDVSIACAEGRSSPVPLCVSACTAFPQHSPVHLSPKGCSWHRLCTGLCRNSSELASGYLGGHYWLLQLCGSLHFGLLGAVSIPWWWMPGSPGQGSASSTGACGAQREIWPLHCPGVTSQNFQWQYLLKALILLKPCVIQHQRSYPAVLTIAFFSLQIQICR